MSKRIVLVTGSSRGIGFGIAKAFIKNGDTVILNGHKDNLQLTQAVNTLKQMGGNCTGILSDLSDYENAKNLVEQIKQEYGFINVLVNNAGVAHFGLFTDLKPQEIQELLAVNLNTAINMSHLAIPSMVREKSGVIVNITSIWGVTGASCEVVYSTAKAGIIGLTKALSKELAPSGIRVNAIACGAFETRMNEHLNDEEKNAFMDEIPLGRFGLPDEAGDLAVFLASEKSKYLTGQVIPLDGGYL